MGLLLLRHPSSVQVWPSASNDGDRGAHSDQPNKQSKPSNPSQARVKEPGFSFNTTEENQGCGWVKGRHQEKGKAPLPVPSAHQARQGAMSQGTLGSSPAGELSPGRAPTPAGRIWGAGPKHLWQGRSSGRLPSRPARAAEAPARLPPSARATAARARGRGGAGGRGPRARRPPALRGSRRALSAGVQGITGEAVISRARYPPASAAGPAEKTGGRPRGRGGIGSSPRGPAFTAANACQRWRGPG